MTGGWILCDGLGVFVDRGPWTVDRGGLFEK
jgi:hypothetical protein